MEVISHRGFWKNIDEHNKPVALERSFTLNMGTEVDLRDYNGEIVVEHDVPTSPSLLFSDLLRIMDGRNLTLALNIKADGLSSRIKKILSEFNHTNYFLFDMSIPDLIQQLKNDMKVFTGFSDIQPYPVMIDKCEGIWLDSFYSEWYGPGIVDEYINKGKRVCIVSADLHKRPTENQWNMIKTAKNTSSSNLLLCTDKPLEAREFFKVV